VIGTFLPTGEEVLRSGALFKNDARALTLRRARSANQLFVRFTFLAEELTVRVPGIPRIVDTLPAVAAAYDKPALLTSGALRGSPAPVKLACVDRAVPVPHSSKTGGGGPAASPSTPSLPVGRSAYPRTPRAGTSYWKGWNSHPGRTGM
jgi:hypothetical protein